jgi:putative ABC transport system permease protein
MTGLFQDFRYALRQLQKSPGFAFAAVLTLALGIGANTAIFSVINTTLLQPLPYKNADALVKIWGTNLKKGVDVDLLSAAEIQDLRNQSTSFVDIGSSTDQVYNLTNAGDPESIPGYELSANFFDLLGVNPILGRSFSRGEDTAGREHVVVLAYQLWKRRFNGDHGIVGKTITLNNEPFTVIGVMPADFYYPVRDNQLWTPLVVPPGTAADRSLRFLRVLARLKPSVSLPQAQTEIATIAGRIAAEHADTNAGQGALVVSLKGEATRDIRPALLTLMGAVGFVLLIACANVANLLLTRSAKRRGELAVRAALGASRSRLVRQFLTESILLSLLGGSLGVLLASFSVNGLVRMFPPTISNLNIPRVESIPIDLRVLGFALLVSIVTAVLFGTVPALAVRLSLHEHLQEAGRGSRGLRSGAYRGLLVTSEIALTLMLLIGAGLLMRSFDDLVSTDLGFNPKGVLTFRIILPETRYASEVQQRVFGEQILERVKALPGVRSAGAVTFLPLSGWYGVRTFTIAGRSAGNAGSNPPLSWSAANPGYFRTMGITTIKGRGFDERDTSASPPIMVISESTARKYWPNADPLGAQATLKFEKVPRTVVGVVGDVRQFGAVSAPTPQVYVPFQQAPASLICFAVRTDSNPISLATAVERAVWAVDKDQPVSYVISMDQLVSESIAPQRILMFLVIAFGGLALAMASVGVYSVMAYSVVQRTQEIGIRLALGAGQPEVLRFVLMRGIAFTATGVGLGVAGALALTRFLQSMLYGIGSTDLLTFMTASVVLSAMALFASYIPARRAAKVDPMVALRYE